MTERPHKQMYDLAWKLHDVTPFAIELMLLDIDEDFAKQEERELDEELGWTTSTQKQESTAE